MCCFYVMRYSKRCSCRCHAELARISSRALARLRECGALTWNPDQPVGGGGQGAAKQPPRGDGTDLVADSACRISGSATGAPDIEKGIQ
jgi:hypothetical protein